MTTRKSPARKSKRRKSTPLTQRLLESLTTSLSNGGTRLAEFCHNATHVIFSNPFKKNPRQLKREQSVFKGRLQFVGILFVTAMLGYTWMQDYPQMVYDHMADSILSTSQKAGFKVTDIVIKGRVHAPSQKILESIELTRNDPIFKYSPEEVRTRLKTVSWIRDAKVRRHLPNTFLITIVEREPLAIWQNQQKHFLVDDEGVVISEQITPEYKKLPMIVGANAPIHVSKILSNLIKHPDIQKRVTALVLVSGRRWNLQLDGSMDIKLPEKNLDEALGRLTKLLLQSTVNFKEVKAIDMRQGKQMTIRLANGAEV